MLLQQSRNLIRVPELVINLAVFRLSNRSKLNCKRKCVSGVYRAANLEVLTLLTAQLGRIHCLAEHLNSHGAGLI